MIISLNWLKKYTKITLDPSELAERVGARIVEVESVTDLGAKYAGIVVAEVISAKPIEGTDHLNLVYINDAGVTKDVKRESDDSIQVVCGAPNVRKGIKVAWLPPGSTVPSSFGTPEPFILGTRKLQGYVSNGMLASAKELDLYDDHTGIIEVDSNVQPGDDFAKSYELDDYLFDIENKSLTHRPDMFGMIGFAREVAAVQGLDYVSPQWLIDDSLDGPTETSQELRVIIDEPSVAERYQAMVFDNIDTTRETPLSIKTYLARVGVRPINAVVDITNYLMIASGQPLHAFDYDKVMKLAGPSPEIHVRHANQGEKLELLDGRTIEMSTSDIVIAAGKTPIGLAGAMGGADTVIDSSTKRVIVESATFDLYALRATQMRHGIFSEAITRFTKGQPARLTQPVLVEAARLLGEWTNARIVSKMFEAVGTVRSFTPISLEVSRLNDTLGTAVSQNQIVDVLHRVEFSIIEESENTIVVTPPFWRTDIRIAEDVIEEFGRIEGFDSIQPVLPVRTFKAVEPQSFDVFRKSVADLLSRDGANEVVTYSFVHGDILKKAGEDLTNSYKIINSISPDLQYYRQTLTPSLLNIVYQNSKQGFDEFAVYELNKVHPKILGETHEHVPVERDSLALVVSAKKSDGRGNAYYDAKHIFELLTVKYRSGVSYVPLDENTSASYRAFEPRQSAQIVSGDGTIIGVVGAYRRSVAASFKLPDHTAGFEVDMRALYKLYSEGIQPYVPLSKYPSTQRDISLRVDTTILYRTVYEALSDALAVEKELVTTVTPLDIYSVQGSSTKNITFRIDIVSYTQTLTGNEVGDAMARVIKGVVAKTGAEIL